MKYAPIPMVPGPTTVHPDVLATLAKDYGSGQIDARFLELYARTGKQLQSFMGTGNDVVIMTGEGMLALWAALKSCLKQGDTVVSIGTGVFGDGIGEMAASMGCRVEAISLPYDSTINTVALEKIEATIRRVKPDMLTAVHCETPSGTLNPLEQLGEIKRRLGVPLFYVDAVASVGGVPVEADAWNIDLLLTGSQKCLSAPPSLSMLAVSDVAWERMTAINYQGYDSILPFRTVQQDGRCPYTPYWHGVAALNVALSLLEKEGKESVFARHRQVAENCAKGLLELGIRLFPSDQAVSSPTVTAALIPPGFTWPQWQQALLAQGLVVSGSFGPMAGKVFRLGHMGLQADVNLMEQALTVLRRLLGK